MTTALAALTTPETAFDTNITREDFRKKPWKYIGYEGFSTFVASDNDFFFLRRFGTLHARVLLSLQDQLVELEQRLKDLEKSHRFRLSRFWRTQPSGTGDDLGVDTGDTYYSSDEKIEQFASLVILVLGVVMLIGPLWALEFVDGPVNRLGLITVFIVFFITLVSLATVAKPFESLAATAA